MGCSGGSGWERLGVEPAVRVGGGSGLLRLVDGDAEVRGEALETVGVALTQRAELPAVPAAVQLAADQRGLLAGLRADVEGGQRLTLGDRGVVQQNAEGAYAVKGGAVRRSDQEDLADLGLDTRQICLDRVGEALGDPLLAEPPDLPGGVPGLVVEDEVLVGSHTTLGAEEQRGGVDVRDPCPGVQRSTARTVVAFSGTFDPFSIACVMRSSCPLGSAHDNAGRRQPALP